ncbi:MAG TPA: hypothetical protein PL037_04900, partial [Elusimicrobiales bacterium]|nr:hypothetical protein [Elusimicrobiales bacterium]
LGEKELGAALSETAALDGRLSSILGPDILREIEERDKAELAVSHLRRVRAALIAYYAAHEGEYPDDPSGLVPGYLDAMPALELPGHPATAGVSAYKGPAREAGEAVSDSGGWLYFSDKASPYFGMIVLNCTHKDPNGREFYRY